MANDTPEYAQGEHASIIGYEGADNEWHYITDDDWKLPSYDDMEHSEHYLIRLDTEGGPEGMPDTISWYGFIWEDLDLDTIYDYYTAVYEGEVA